MAIKKGDFIELDYTAKELDDNKIFDTTIQKVAEEAGLLHSHEPGHNHDHSDQYHPIIICVGEKQVLPGLDAKIEGKDLGKHKIKLAPEEAFGKKSAKLLKMMPMRIFKEQKIRPYVGLELNIDDQLGTVRSVSGGRIIVDFNHPLASKEIEYDLEIKRMVTDKKEQIESVLKLTGIKPESVSVKEKNAEIKLKAELPKEFSDMLKKELTRILGIEIEFTSEKAEKKQESKNTEKKEEKTQKPKKDEETDKTQQ